MAKDGWTIETIRADLLARIEGLDRLFTASSQQSKERVDLALAASKEAVSKAEIATEKRFDAVNEFRGALSDQTNRLMPRAEYEVQHRALIDRIDLAAAALTRLEAGIAGKGAGIGSVGSIFIGTMVAVAALAAVGAFLMSLFHK
jgi:hypothetical protein